MSQANITLACEGVPSHVGAPACMPWPARPVLSFSEPQPPDPDPVEPAAQPAVETLEALIAYVDTQTDWSVDIRGDLRSAIRQIGRTISLIRARDGGQPFDPNPDLARIRLDIPAINRALKGMSFRLAGFEADKTWRNAKTGFRRACRRLQMIAPAKLPPLPPDSPYQPFLARATRFESGAALRFASGLHAQQRHPAQVTDADVADHRTFLLTRTIGGKADDTLRRIVRLWNETARHEPGWPQTPLTLPGGGPKPASPPFSAYSAAVQDEVESIHGWLKGTVVFGMAGSERSGPFHRQRDRKPLRPETIKHRLAYLRLVLGVHVELGHDPQSIASLRTLLVPKTMQAILQALWDRGQLRQQAIPELEREYNESGNTGQTAAAGGLLLILATHCFHQPPDVLKQIQKLARQVRNPPRSEMSRKNSRRLDQFMDPVKLGLLLNLPQTMMREAMALRADRSAEAARLARTAIIFAIECRIPLRIKNLQSCRLGHNLRFAGAQSQVVTLTFQEHETKNYVKIEFYVGPRLCGLLKTYIEHFLPLFAADSPDFPANQWLFPAGKGREGPVCIDTIRTTIKDTMAERVGAVFHPHLFRGLAVKLCLDHSPGALEHCRQLLGDKTLEIVLRYYTQVMRKQASQHQDRLVDAEADRLAGLAAATRRTHRKADRS
jgi:integrase